VGRVCHPKPPSHYGGASKRFGATEVSTNEFIGGIGASPIITTAGEIDEPGEPVRFLYGETTQRAVSVDTAAMTEALNKIYGAEALVSELNAR
jgi:hypothetical protein